MIGLIYITAIALFLMLVFYAMRWAWRRGRKNEGSVFKGLMYALAGFMVVYLAVFWKLIPTIVVHRHFCAIDAGFKEFVTPQEWARQNPATIERLRGVDLEAFSKRPETSDGYFRDVDFGGVLGHDIRATSLARWGVKVRKVEHRVVDMTSETILATATDYSTGRGGELSVWLTRSSCFESIVAPVDKLIQFSRSMKEQVK